MLRLALAAWLVTLTASAWTQETLTQEQTDEPPQPPTRLQRIWKNVNENKIVATLQLDRDEYMAGETMAITVTVRNPSETPLEAPKPDPLSWFRHAAKWDPNYHGRVSPIEGGDEVAKATGWIPFGEGDRFGNTEEQEDIPYVVLQPGQTLTAKFHSYEMYFKGASDYPGTDRMSFPGASAEYQVMASVLERSIDIKLQKPTIFTTETGQTETYKRKAEVYVLGSKGRHFICVSQQDLAGMPHRFHPNADGTMSWMDVDAIASYTRFAENDTPILTLMGTADADDNLTITWTTAQASAPNGIQSHVLKLEKAQWMVDNEHRGPKAWKESERIEIR
jgi:hypothetical protein